ncbi:MAG: hypothetical protein M1814_001501 [Vezdaea aestivalis]|nr:MAG: hypothetical protein M1814_001501 [Vezdaea aestivalis]
MAKVTCDQVWNDYFHSLPLATIRGIDTGAHVKRLVEEDQQLFSGQGDVELWQTDGENTTKSTLDPDNIDTSLDSMIFIGQKTSWSPLQTSTGTFQKLLKAYQVSPVFLEALYAFGWKFNNDEDPHFNLCEEQWGVPATVRVHHQLAIFFEPTNDMGGLHSRIPGLLGRL